MNRTIGIAIIISAITLVGMLGIAANYSPAPAHAQQCKGWLLPGSQGQICFQTKKKCEAALAAAGSTLECHRSKG